MQLVTVPPPLAPLATGHPLSLPDIKRLRESAARVDPIAKGGQTSGWDSALPGRNPQLGQHLQRHDSDHIPPPSLMQLTISELLAEQISEIGKGTSEDEAASGSKADAAENEPTESPLRTLALPGYERAQRALASPHGADSAATEQAQAPDPAASNDTGTGLQRPN